MIPIPYLALALGAGAVALGKLIHKAITSDMPTSESRPAPPQADRQEEIRKEREAARASLVREASDDARREMALLLDVHADVVQGAIKLKVEIDDLRQVASFEQGIDGVTILAPLAVNLGYTSRHKTRTRQLGRLASQRDALRELIEGLRWMAVNTRPAIAS